MCNKTQAILYKEWIPQEWIKATPDRNGYLKEGTGVTSDFVNEGELIQWGTDYKEFESGPGMYTVAVVKLKDGTIKMIHPTLIKFVISEETKPTEEFKGDPTEFCRPREWWKNKEFRERIQEVIDRVEFIMTTCTDEKVKQGQEQALRVIKAARDQS
jgi:hypothetical protein